MSANNLISDSDTRSTLAKTFSSILDAGREILAKRNSSLPTTNDPVEALVNLCKELLKHRGEASGLALASEITAAYRALTAESQLGFFNALATDFEVDGEAVLEAADEYKKDNKVESLWKITRLSEAPRVQLLKRINMAKDGTKTLVAMRKEILDRLNSNPLLRGVETDFKNLFVSWFNKGFLEMRRIDWSSPALVLEKIIAYEAVHQINGWEDLRSRLQEDRRCFAFFHPALENEPLVFVEIALTEQIPNAIAPLLQQDRKEVDLKKVNTVVFYSISNCQAGLTGISFGNFLIKNVVEELKSELPSLATFVTLSPIPGFLKWLERADLTDLVDADMASKVLHPVGSVADSDVYQQLEKLCAHYLLKEKFNGLAKDPVARFHLGNGARLQGLHRDADLSEKGRQQSAGIMVNYLYDLEKIEINHEAYFEAGEIAVAGSIKRLLA
jgi:malonyl-CoA decarboxylase